MSNHERRERRALRDASGGASEPQLASEAVSLILRGRFLETVSEKGRDEHNEVPSRCGEVEASLQ
jgi:hypothetical protein